MQQYKDQSRSTLIYSIHEIQDFSIAKILSLAEKKAYKEHLTVLYKSPFRTIIVKRLRNSPNVTSVCFDPKTTII